MPHDKPAVTVTEPSDNDVRHLLVAIRNPTTDEYRLLYERTLRSERAATAQTEERVEWEKVNGLCRDALRMSDTALRCVAAGTPDWENVSKSIKEALAALDSKQEGGRRMRITRQTCKTCGATEVPCGSTMFIKRKKPVENIADRHKHGRTAWGERSPHAKLKDEQVIEMRRIWKEGKPSKASLARMFSVSAFAVNEILCERRWKHLLPEIEQAEQQKKGHANE